jgi:hypothetical protein
MTITKRDDISTATAVSSSYVCRRLCPYYSRAPLASSSSEKREIQVFRRRQHQLKNLAGPKDHQIVYWMLDVYTLFD